MRLVDGLVSIIMSNYNTPEEYLRVAIESVLNQTYTNFEFIIIDDCSTDNSLGFIKSYDDERIVVLENKKNLGITKSLNRGLSVAKGEFIARMDADDVCFTTRLEKQVDFLKNNPQVIVCGTGAELIGDWQERHSNKVLFREIPEKDLFKVYLLFGNYPNIIHPTAMFNNKLLIENNIKYDDRYIYAQDFRMWVECARYGECRNLNEILLKYRVHNNAVTVSKKEQQKECAKNIMAEQLSWLNLQLPDNWEVLHWELLKQRKPYDLECKKWIKKIIEQNRVYNVYNQRHLERLLFEKWAEISYFALAKNKSLSNIIKVVINLPLKYWPALLKIKKNRVQKY